MEMKNLMAELKEKAKAAKTPEEIQAIAKENGMEDFSLESAKAYYKQFHKEGELKVCKEQSIPLYKMRVDKIKRKIYPQII